MTFNQLVEYTNKLNGLAKEKKDHTVVDMIDKHADEILAYNCSQHKEQSFEALVCVEAQDYASHAKVFVEEWREEHMYDGICLPLYKTENEVSL